MSPKTAIILAGGRGTRLNELIPDVPKAIAPVNGQPFLNYLLQYFISTGIDKFIFALGFGHESIRHYLDEQFPLLDRQFAIEAEPLGTGGAVRNALPLSTENTVVVINGDTLYKVRLEAIAAFHHMCGAECTIALKPMKSVSRYGEVVLNKDYTVAEFTEKKLLENGLINGGVYILNKRLFEQTEWPVVFSFEEDYLATMHATRRIFGYQQDGYFMDIGIPEDFNRAQEEFKLFI
jgi:D-glycero-alpha-D-manno-heptose 1-phosphate guanylyltransferase